MLIAKWLIQNNRRELTLFIIRHMECCGDISYLRIPITKEESFKWKDKGITMAQ